jgi:hypothetical protein
MICDFRTGELRHTCGGLYTKWFGVRVDHIGTSKRYDGYEHAFGLGLGHGRNNDE